MAALPWCWANLKHIHVACSLALAPFAILFPIVAAMCGALGVWSERAAAAAAAQTRVPQGTGGAYRQVTPSKLDDGDTEWTRARSVAFLVMVVGTVAALGLAIWQSAVSVRAWVAIAGCEHEGVKCACEANRGAGK